MRRGVILGDGAKLYFPKSGGAAKGGSLSWDGDCDGGIREMFNMVSVGD